MATARPRRTTPPTQVEEDTSALLDFTLAGTEGVAFEGKGMTLEPETEVTPPKRMSAAPSAPAERKPLARGAAVKSVSTGLKGAHKMAAKLFDEPDLELQPDEAKALAEASIDLLKVYGIDLSTHPKIAAWLEFGSVLGEVEGPRLVLVVTRQPRRRDSEADDEPMPAIILPEWQGSL